MRSLIFYLLLGLAIAFALLWITVSPYSRRLRERFHIWKLRRLAGRLEAVMVAGSAVKILDRPGGFQFAGTFVLDPGLIAAGAREIETVAVPGVAVGDVATVAPRAAKTVLIGYTRCSANQIEFSLENNTAGGVDEASDTWDFQIHRGTTGPLR